MDTIFDETPDLAARVEQALANHEKAANENIAVDAVLRPRLKLVRFEEITPRTSNRYLIKGLLDRGALSVIYGDAGSGKTFFALDLALHCALNRPWLGRRVAGGPAVYVAAEGGGGLFNRVTAFQRHHRIEGNVPFAVLPTSVDLCSEDGDTDELITLINAANPEARPALVVVDTLARAISPGNENAPNDMGAFIGHLDRIRENTGAHVLVVHHAGKDAARGARGHSSLRAAVDTEVELQRRAGTSIARVTKQKEGITEGYVSFVLQEVAIGEDEDRDVINSCVVIAAENVESTGQREDLSQSQNVALDVLHELTAEVGELVADADHIPPTARCVRYHAWRQRSLAAGVGSSAQPKNRPRVFLHVREKLTGMGLVGAHMEWVWLA